MEIDYQRQYYLKHRARIIARSRQLALSNPDLRKKIQRQWRARHGAKPRIYRPAECHPDRKHKAKGMCKKCYAASLAKIYSPIYAAKNPDKKKLWRRREYLNHKERYRVRSKIWGEKNKDRMRQWFRGYLRHRRINDLNFKMASILRCRFRHALARKQKSGSAIELLGCSIEDFWIYLESKFEPGMTRENHGKVWHLDHIMPCAIFDLSKSDHQRRCFHFSNLHPLFAKDNIRKGARIQCEQFHLGM